MKTEAQLARTELELSAVDSAINVAHYFCDRKYYDWKSYLSMLDKKIYEWIAYLENCEKYR